MIIHIYNLSAGVAQLALSNPYASYNIFYVFSESINVSNVQRIGGTQILNTGAANKPYLTIVTQASGEVIW